MAVPRLAGGLVLLYCVLRLQLSSCTVIANSQLQTCVRDGSTTDASLSCSQKLITTLAVQSGASLATEQLAYSVPCVNSPDGNCPCKCNYAVDAGCTCRDLAQSINITLTKTPVYATFPLTYRKAFNSKPYEAIIQTGGTQTINTCEDGALATGPTCGWALDLSGNRITDSQGFCCTCSLSQIGGDTLGGGSTQGTRANLDCNLFDSGFLFTPGSAHCLRYADLWYEGYDVGVSSLAFTINVTITSQTAGSAASTTEVLVLSPSTPFILSGSKLAAANLLGDLATFTALPVLQGNMLFIPHPNGMGPQATLSYMMDKWVLLDKSLVTLDGSECNKVGLSYSAFRTQGDRCGALPGTCLASQLQDYVDSDNARIAQGKTPQYFVSKWGGGTANKNQVSKPNSNTFLLQLPITSIQNSIVTLTVRADTLKLVTNSSPGKVLRVAVCKFANVSCGSFEAVSEQGYLQATIQNTGSIDANYIVTVSNCSSAVKPVDAQSAALAARETRTLVFQLFMVSDAGGNFSCSAGLRDAQGQLTDSKDVAFSTTSTNYTTPPSQSDISGKVTGGNAPKGMITTASCSDICTSWYNLWCIAWNHCWGLLMKFLAIMLAIAAAISLIWVAFSRGWLAKVFARAGEAVGAAASTAGGRRGRSKGRRSRHAEGDSEEDESDSDGGPKRSRSSKRGKSAAGRKMKGRAADGKKCRAPQSESESESGSEGEGDAEGGHAGRKPGKIKAAHGPGRTEAGPPHAQQPRRSFLQHMMAQDWGPPPTPHGRGRIDGSRAPMALHANPLSAGMPPGASGRSPYGAPLAPYLSGLQRGMSQQHLLPGPGSAAYESGGLELQPAGSLRQQYSPGRPPRRGAPPPISPPTPGADMDAALEQLLDGYEAAGVAYADARAMAGVAQGSGLAEVGPSACLAGDVQLIEDMQGQGLQVLFTLSSQRTYQMLRFNPQFRGYEPLQHPRPLDAGQLVLLLSGPEALQAISLQERGECLN